MIAALALMTIACSNDNELTPQQPSKTGGIPFIATFSGNGSAVTRALSEETGKIVSTWVKDEQVALIYNVGETKCKTIATVDEVDEEGTATITATLEDGTVDGTEVTIIYPASAVDDTGEVKSDLLENQAGTLEYISKYLDLHMGTGHLSIDGTATLQESVKLEGKIAIFNLSLAKLTPNNNDPFTELVVSFDDENGKYQVAASVDIPENTNQFCVALRPGTILPNFSHPTLWFEATTTSGKKYINHGKSKEEYIVVVENKYYHTNVSLATVGDFILSSGKFVEKDNNQGIAVIAHVGKVDNYFDRFLALAREDISGEYYTLAKAQNAVKTYASNNSFGLPGETTPSSFYDKVVNNKTTASNKRSSELGVERGWRLPTVTDWRYVFQNLGNGDSATNPIGISTDEYVDGEDLREAIDDACNLDNELEADLYWTSSQFENSENAWSYDFDDYSCFHEGEAVFARAVFAY